MDPSTTHATTQVRHLTRSQIDARDKLLRGVLWGLGIDDEARVLREAASLGIDLITPRIALAIDTAPPSFAADAIPSEWARKHVESVSKRLMCYFERQSNVICTYLGKGEIAVLPPYAHLAACEPCNGVPPTTPSGTRNEEVRLWKEWAAELVTRLPNEVGVGLRVGIGRRHAGIVGLERSYHSARLALHFGYDFPSREQVYYLDDLLIRAFLHSHDSRAKAELGEYLLAPLQDDPTLLSTLGVFFEEDCCPSIAAARLVIHRNTLGYRLDKITALTGLDPRRFEQAVRFRLALDLRNTHYMVDAEHGTRTFT